MATLETLVVKLATEATEYARGLNDASSKTSAWGSKLAGLAGKAALGAMAAAGAAIAAVGVAGVKEFVGFQNSMNEVFTLLPGMSTEAMGAMQEDVKNFAKEFGVLPNETVPALYQAISAGVPKDNVFDFLEVAQKAARGGVTSLETAVDGISSTMNAYGADIVNATQASDLMFTAVRLGKTTLDELSKSLFNVNPTAAALGVNFGDVTAALAAMTAQGVPTSVATTQLRQLFVEMSKEGSKTADVFSEIAGKSFKQFVAEGGNTQDALKLLEQYAASTGVGISDLFGSVEAGNAALALTGKGTETFTANLAAMAGSTGATEAAFKQMDEGAQASLDRLKAGWASMLLDIGKRGDQAFSLILGAAEKALPVVAGWFVGVADAAAKGVEWIQANWPAISETVQGVVDRVSGLLAGVLGPSIDGAQGKFAWVTDWVQENLPLMRQTVETVVGAITAFWDKHGAMIMRIVGNFMSVVSTIFDTYLKNAFDIVKAIMQLITGDFEGAGETVRGIFERTFSSIVEIIGLQLDNVRTLITGIDWGALGRSIIQGIANGISAAHELVVSAMVGAAQGAIDAAKRLLGINSPSKVMADEVGGPMAQGIADGFARTMGKANFDIPQALDFASGRTSGFDVLGNVFNSRDMIAALKQAGELAARMAESGAAQLATLRDGIGDQVGYAKDLIASLRDTGDAANQENGVRRLEAILAQMSEAINFDFAPGVALPDALRMGEGSGGTGERESGGAGQTNYFTFNIVASDQAAAKAGVLSGLRSAGVAFA